MMVLTSFHVELYQHVVIDKTDDHATAQSAEVTLRSRLQDAGAKLYQPI